MALGRGGDQAVIKIKPFTSFTAAFQKGWKNGPGQSRIVGQCSLELIATADRVLVMGHKFGDLDCVRGGCGHGLRHPQHREKMPTW